MRIHALLFCSLMLSCGQQSPIIEERQDSSAQNSDTLSFSDWVVFAKKAAGENSPQEKQIEVYQKQCSKVGNDSSEDLIKTCTELKEKLLASSAQKTNDDPLEQISEGFDADPVDKEKVKPKERDPNDDGVTLREKLSQKEKDLIAQREAAIKEIIEAGCVEKSAQGEKLVDSAKCKLLSDKVNDLRAQLQAERLNNPDKVAYDAALAAYRKKVDEIAKCFEVKDKKPDQEIVLSPECKKGVDEMKALYQEVEKKRAAAFEQI